MRSQNLHLVTGYQEVDATGAFQANNNPVALQTLTDFAQGSDNILGITGCELHRHPSSLRLY